MATKMLSEKLGEVEYDNLIVGLTPPKRVGAGKIASTGSKEATSPRPADPLHWGRPGGGRYGRRVFFLP